MIKFVDLNAQYLHIKAEMDDAIAKVISESAFIGGRHVRQFEESFAGYQGAANCVGVGNGTDAIEIALESLGLPVCSEVLAPANSFIASSEAITRAGHRVVFCDVDPQTHNLSIEDAARRVTSTTRAILAVHLYGRPCAMDQVLALADRHDLKVIEDCAQAQGAEFASRRVGTYGSLGTFSFYPGKNLGAYGDAGAIVTNDAKLAEKCRKIANHGRIAKYDHEFEGRNSRLDGLQAAILSVKLRHLEAWTARRNELAELYRNELAECPGVTLPASTSPGMRAVYHLFVIRTRQRDALRKYLQSKEIECGIHYPTSLPRLPAYRHLEQHKEPMIANQICDEVLSLPMGEHLSEAEIMDVASVIREFHLQGTRT